MLLFKCYTSGHNIMKMLQLFPSLVWNSWWCYTSGRPRSGCSVVSGRSRPNQQTWYKHHLGIMINSHQWESRNIYNLLQIFGDIHKCQDTKIVFFVIVCALHKPRNIWRCNQGKKIFQNKEPFVSESTTARWESGRSQTVTTSSLIREISSYKLGQALSNTQLSY